jgi:AraC-like DNA-binding protein
LQIEKVEAYILAISSEAIYADYLNLLEQTIAPAKGLAINSDMISVFNQTLSLCLTIFERNNNKFYPSLLKNYCNAFVGLIISQYLEQLIPLGSLSRFEIVTKEFKQFLERGFALLKRPSDYASALHISTPYLNECVRKATGFSVSYHIQQRIILEAKRLLYHSHQSVKEIAIQLGYQDYAYFSRLFTKIARMTPIAFRNKNLG